MIIDLLNPAHCFTVCLLIVYLFYGGLLGGYHIRDFELKAKNEYSFVDVVIIIHIFIIAVVGLIGFYKLFELVVKNF